MRRAWLRMVAAGALAILLAASILAGLGMSRADDEATLRTLDGILHTDFTLQRDVLLVRAGLLGNYDPLVSESDRLDAGLDGLLGRLRRRGCVDAAARALSEAVHEQDALTEQLKSEQAVARNSLSYLPLLGEQVAANDVGLAGPVQALTEAVLRLDVDNTPAAGENVRLRIAAVSALVAPDDHASMLHYVLAHALLLQRVLPRIDALLHAIIGSDLPARVAAVRREADGRRAALQAEMRLYGAAVNAMLLLFLLTLAVRFFLVFRRRRGERVENAAAENIVTLTSMHFVACEPEQTGNVLDRALATIGQRTGFDRICVVLLDPERQHVWDRRQQAPPPELRRLLLAAAAAAAPGDAFEAASPAAIGGGGPGSFRLSDFRLGGFRLRDGEQIIGLMTFETMRQVGRRPACWPASGIAIYRQAAAIVERALRQERLAAEREAQQPRLRQAQRLVTAGELASGLAHNLNNIIGAVVGHAEMMSDCLTRATSPAQHIDGIRQAAERATELVETMLNFGRRDLSRDEVAISALMSETLSLLRVTLPLRVSLSTTDEAAGALVVGRAAELQQVMLNLVRNASQAIEGNGRITLSLTTAEIAVPWPLPYGTVQPGPYVMLSVADTGCGMDRQTLARIFEPFFTTRPAGSGLGLATVADIVRDHGGVIDVQSTPGAGSVFTAWLPQAVGAQAGAASVGRGEIVLFVEPDRERRLQIEDILAALSYEPVGFATREEAINSFAEAPFDYDAWLNYPPEPDGKIDHDAITRIRRLRPGMPIVLVGIAHRPDRLRKTLPAQAVVIEPRSGTVGLAAGLSSLLHVHSS